MMAAAMLVVSVLALVACTSAQQPHVLDSFSVPQSTIWLYSGGQQSNFNCVAPSNVSSVTLAGGIRKLQLSAPSNTNATYWVQLGVLIPYNQTTAPFGVQSNNGNSNSTIFQALYRLDGDTALCSSGSPNTQSYYPISRMVSNLNLNLQALGAYAFQFNASASYPNQLTVTMYSPTGVQLAQSFAVTLFNSGWPLFVPYTLPFSDSSKWVSGSRFTGIVGAIEISWTVPANHLFGINNVQFLITPTSSISARVFTDCGCNGFNEGIDMLQSGVAVTLSIAGPCASLTQSQITSSSGTVTFYNLPSGCTYTLSVSSGLNLCAQSPAVRVVQLGDTADFATQGTSASIVMPPNVTVMCGSDTSPSSTGTATVANGSCGGAMLSYSDSFSNPRCTAPGGTIQVISRAWSGAGVTQTQTITVMDRKEISVSAWLPTVAVPCNTPPTLAPSPTFTSCTAVGVAVSTQPSNNCTLTGPCTAVTYKATDQCGNTISLTQYVVQDCPSNLNCRFICDEDPATPATCSIVEQGSLLSVRLCVPCATAHLCTTTAQALMSLFRETRGFEWKSKANWGSGLPCNQTWFGVSCDSSGNVISLSLPRNHLVGVIPSSLSGACALKTIHLHENSMFEHSIACAWMKLDSHTFPREQFSVERFLNLSRLSLWNR